MLNPKKLILLAVFISYAYSSDNTVTYGGQTYKTVKIGEQVWFAENLNYKAEGSKCYGEKGKVIVGGDAVAGLSYSGLSVVPITKILPDNEVQANCAKYGRLYNWETAMKVCPKGWHLPSNEDWEKLFRFVDGNTGSRYKEILNTYDSPTAGKHLKTASGWQSSRESKSWSLYEDQNNGTDDYGFSALPGGEGNDKYHTFDWVGEQGKWWSASIRRHRNIDGHYSKDVYHLGTGNIDGFLWHISGYPDNISLYSVRCVQD